jgi:hypothetical protein
MNAVATPCLPRRSVAKAGGGLHMESARSGRRIAPWLQRVRIYEKAWLLEKLTALLLPQVRATVFWPLRILA